MMKYDNLGLYVSSSSPYKNEMHVVIVFSNMSYISVICQHMYNRMCDRCTSYNNIDLGKCEHRRMCR